MPTSMQLSLISVFMRTMPDGFHLAISLGAVPVFLLGLTKVRGKEGGH